jgi:hypothetical protein
MDRQTYNNYLIKNFLPKRYPTADYNNSQTYQPQQTQPTQSYTYQNVMIGGGMMTVKVPVQYPNLTPVQIPVQTPFSPTPVQVRIHVPTSTIQPISTTNTNTSTHQSAGVIIIDDEYRINDPYLPPNSKRQTILLGLNPRSGKYELFYGKKDPNDSVPIETAHRECTEETSNLFRFDMNLFSNSYCVKSPNQKHYAFVIRVRQPQGGIQSKYFYSNLLTMQYNGTVPHQWTEMTGITRISIVDAIKSLILSHQNGSDFTMFDVYNKRITICARDAEFIRDALKNKYNLFAPIYQLKDVQKYDSRYFGGKNVFLNGTHYYTV